MSTFIAGIGPAMARACTTRASRRRCRRIPGTKGAHGAPVAAGAARRPGPGPLRATPSANDNASVVAPALLGAARVLAGLPLGGDGCAVRFLWCPEFVGTAAYLHDVVHARTMAGPVAAINVDMAGEDVGQCGGSLIIERGPDDVANPLPALSGRCAALLPPTRRSYSGAVPADPWTWRFAPYAGGSDHAIAAGPPTRCPVISLGHWPDRFNHSSADTVEAVDPAELRRTATILTATVGALRGRGDPELAVDVAAATGAWAAGHILDALPGRLPPPPITSAGTADPDAAEPGAYDQGADVPRVYDPNEDGAAHRRLWHRAEVAAAAVDASRLTGVEAHQRAVVACSVAAIASAAAGQIPASAPEPTDDGSRLVGRWTGPTNLRALAGDATPEDRAYLDQHLAADRGGNLARIVALLDAVYRPGRTRSAAAMAGRCDRGTRDRGRVRRPNIRSSGTGRLGCRFGGGRQLIALMVLRGRTRGF